MTTITDQLLTNRTFRDEKANIALAKKISGETDAEAVNEVFRNLSNKKLESDCIKILYEIAGRSPALVADYADYFIELLDRKNNRIVWGAMTAIEAICSLKIDLVYSQVEKLQTVVEQGSVITRDHFVNILLILAPAKPDVLLRLFQQLADCPPNQLPMYAERSLSVLNKKNSSEFVEIMIQRLGEMATESKRKRLEKVIKKLS